MKKFMDYSENLSSERYDKTRSTIGFNLIEPYLKSYSQKDATEEPSIVLDLGCGTGNYLQELDNYTNNIQLVGVDRCTDMMLLANKKLNPDFTGNVPESLLITKNGNTTALVQKELGTEVPIPFTADLIISCQVLHHLGGELGAVKLLTEASKCSKIGTTLMINWLPPEQIISYWYLQLIPRLIQDFNKRTVPICRLVYIAKQFGWTVKKVHIHNGEKETLQDYDTYMNYRSPLDETFRVGDSTWSLATEDELKACLDKLSKMTEEEGNDIVSTLDTHRLAFGQATSVVFEKVKDVEEIENLMIKNMD